jgi:hypothetical protein
MINEIGKLIVIQRSFQVFKLMSEGQSKDFDIPAMARDLATSAAVKTLQPLLLWG